MTEIMAAHKWSNNAALIADVISLGFIHGDILDATYGLGRFWSKCRPEGLVTNDKYTEADFNFDFTSFPHEWGSKFDSVVFDPPYKLNGTSTLESDVPYGVHKPATVEKRLDLIVAGAIECLRLVKKGGFFLVKVQNQVSSGRMHFQTDMVTQALNARKVAQMHLLTNPRPQPKGRRQIHPRSNYSTLMIFKKENDDYPFKERM